METRDYTFQIVTKDLSEFSVVYVVPLADFHYGDPHSSVEKFKGYIDWIKQRPNAFTILNGDLINAATKDSLSELFDDLTTPDAAYAFVRSLLMPIKSKILMITRGNHEEQIFRRVGADYMARLAYDLGDMPYKPNGGMVALRLCLHKHHRVFYIYATHGWGGARTIGAKVKKPEDIALGVDADCYIVSHDHTQAIHRLNVIGPPKSRISMLRPIYLITERKVLINTGGFITYGGYVQRKGLAPQDLGTPRLRLAIQEARAEKQTGDYHKDIHASM